MDKERHERLIDFFTTKDAVWKDIQSEIDICINNVQSQIKQKTCENREYLAGYWEALELIRELDRKFKWKKPTP